MRALLLFLFLATPVAAVACGGESDGPIVDARLDAPASDDAAPLDAMTDAFPLDFVDASVSAQPATHRRVDDSCRANSRPTRFGGQAEVEHIAAELGSLYFVQRDPNLTGRGSMRPKID